MSLKQSAGVSELIDTVLTESGGIANRPVPCAFKPLESSRSRLFNEENIGAIELFDLKL